MRGNDSQERHFTGFSRKAFQFLKDIKVHNNKAWYDAHKDDYEQELLDPLRDLNPTWYRYGMGFYDGPDVMAEFRRRIDDDPKAFLKAVAWFPNQDILTLEGESYKRPKGPDKPEPIRTWYNHKSFYLSCSRKIDKAILSPQLVDDLMHGFGLAAPLYHYLLDTIVEAKQPGRSRRHGCF